MDHKVSIDEFDGAKKGIGSKPIILFLGDQWENDSLYTRIQNLLLDLFRGDKAEKISLKGVDHVMACTCLDGKVLIRGYTIAYQKSESKVKSSYNTAIRFNALHCIGCAGSDIVAGSHGPVLRSERPAHTAGLGGHVEGRMQEA